MEENKSTKRIRALLIIVATLLMCIGIIKLYFFELFIGLLCIFLSIILFYVREDYHYRKREEIKEKE